MITETLIRFSVNDDLHRKAYIDTLNLLINKMVSGYKEKALSVQEMLAETGHRTPEEYASGSVGLKQNLQHIEASLNDVVRVLGESEPAVLTLRNTKINKEFSKLLKQLDETHSATVYEWDKATWKVKDSFVAVTRQLLFSLQQPFALEEAEEAKKLDLDEFCLEMKLTEVKPELARLITVSACRGLKTPSDVWDTLTKRQSFLEAFFSPADSDLRDRLVESNRDTFHLIALVKKSVEGLLEEDRRLLNRISDVLYPSVFLALSKADVVLTEDKDRRSAATEALTQFDLIRKGLQRILGREAGAVLSRLKVQTELIRSIALREDF